MTANKPQELLDKYAEVIVKVGLNLQKRKRPQNISRVFFFNEDIIQRLEAG